MTKNNLYGYTKYRPYQKSETLDILGIIEVILSFSIALICYFNGKVERLHDFWLLPFCYAVGRLWVMYRNKNINSLAYQIITIVMFIRYSFSTFLTLTASHYEGTKIYTENYLSVLLLMLYEMFVVFFVIKMFFRKKENLSYNTLTIKKEHEGIVMAFFKVFLVLMTIGIAFTSPAARSTLFNFSFVSSKVNSTSVNEALGGLLFVVFKIGINVIYALVVKETVKYMGINKISFFVNLILSAIYISCNWTGSGNVNRWGLLTSFMVCLIILLKIYPKYKQTIFVMFGSLLIIVLLASSVIKLFTHHGASTSEALSEIFSATYMNEYFQGIYPISNGLRAMDYSNAKINFVTFLDDTISAYPLLNHLFYENGNLTQTFYQEFLNLNDKILPTLCQGYAHFGYIGAPIFSGILTYIALRTDYVMRKSKSIVETLATAQIVTFCSLFMAVNVFIIQRSTMYFVLLYIVIFIDKHLKLKRGKK